MMALVVLIVAILPAEYGVDPTGIGRALGLTALSGTIATEADAISPTVAGTPGTTPAVPRPEELSQDTFDVELRPFEGVEYKYRLEEAGSLVYAWTATAEVEYEFHGEPDGAPPQYFDSYEKGDATGATGSFTAAASGVHGWFWKNNTAERVTVTLRSAGFYSASTEYRDGEQIERRFGAQ
jgi:hypothetical protein